VRYSLTTLELDEVPAAQRGAQVALRADLLNRQEIFGVGAGRGLSRLVVAHTLDVNAALRGSCRLSPPAAAASSRQPTFANKENRPRAICRHQFRCRLFMPQSRPPGSP
jgi:hypothetical protein